MNTIAAFFRKANRLLTEAGIGTARLDALVLLADALRQDKSWVLAHPEHELDATQLKVLEAQLTKRAHRIPLAYVRGKQEFYGRSFAVMPDVLIPRPDTELLIEQLKDLQPSGRLLDVGTGSGAIAITAALEFPELTVDACDISPAALRVAKQNAATLKAPVTFFESDLLNNAKGGYSIIVANLPYVDKIWERSAETTAEPSLALFAGDGGLALIKQLLEQAPDHLQAHAHLLLEADPRQHAELEKAAHLQGFEQVAAEGFALCFKRS